jgi:hypothetical protein
MAQQLDASMPRANATMPDVSMAGRTYRSSRAERMELNTPSRKPGTLAALMPRWNAEYAVLLGRCGHVG